MANKLTCPEHRRQGYHWEQGAGWLCKGCHLSQDLHETNEETLARNRTLEMFPVGTQVVIVDGLEYFDGMIATVIEVNQPTIVGNPGFEIVTMLDFTVEVHIGHEVKQLCFTADELRPVVDATTSALTA